MTFNNKHIVIILIIIIISIFIYNYDVYVVPKNEQLCKPIYVTKRELASDIRSELNKQEEIIHKEGFNNLIDSGFYENFDNSNIKYNVPSTSFSSFNISIIKDPYKIKVFDSVIKVLSYIPTTLTEIQIKQLIEYFAIIYQNSNSLEEFYNNVAISTKINDDSSYNTKYSKFILFLIGKFHNDYLNINHIIDTNQNKNCIVKELVYNTNDYLNKYLTEKESKKDTSSLNIETNTNYIEKYIINDDNTRKKMDLDISTKKCNCTTCQHNIIKHSNDNIIEIDSFNNLEFGAYDKF